MNDKNIPSQSESSDFKSSEFKAANNKSAAPAYNNQKVIVP